MFERGLFAGDNAWHVPRDRRADDEWPTDVRRRGQEVRREFRLEPSRPLGAPRPDDVLVGVDDIRRGHLRRQQLHCVGRPEVSGEDQRDVLPSMQVECHIEHRECIRRARDVDDAGETPDPPWRRGHDALDLGRPGVGHQDRQRPVANGLAPDAFQGSGETHWKGSHDGDESEFRAGRGIRGAGSPRGLASGGPGGVTGGIDGDVCGQFW